MIIFLLNSKANPNFILLAKQATHNLGNFDGYYLYNQLLIYDYFNTSSIIDQHNEFVEISYIVITSDNTKAKVIQFKEKLRIFPVSLNDLLLQ